jgi:aspartyl-tRNA(Asn)/glutamyl-tRNA(Gln) amidotransferase subunit C
MSLSLEQVRHVAQLARLSLSPEEEAQSQKQLSAVLEAIASLGNLDTRSVSPTSHMNLSGVGARVDVAHSSQALLEKALQNAPSVVGTQFAVPKIIE